MARFNYEVTMFFLPLKMRQEIAALPEMEDPMLKEMLLLEPEDLQASLDRMGRQLKARGMSPLVILAYQTLGPAMRENRAVLAYRAQTGSSEVANAIPDLASVDEAVNLAVQEWRLNPREQAQLRQLLLPLAP